MSQNKCEVPNCRNTSDIGYYGKEICESCFEKHNNNKINLKQIFNIQESEPTIMNETNKPTKEEIEMAIQKAKNKSKLTKAEKEAKAKVTKKKKTGEPSRCDIICKHLESGLGSKEKVVAAVMKDKPEDDKAKVGQAISGILRNVSQKTGRWKDYKFVEKDYKIVK